MDAVGLVIGVASLFTTCMQCFEYVQCGKSFGKDYESAILKLDISRMRLARWAESIGLNDPTRVKELQSSLTSREIQIAEILLGAIKEAFDSVEKQSKTYEWKQKLSTSNDDRGL